MTTSAADGSPIGLTVNSFTSVSLDPPLILWCLRRESSTLGTFLEATRFAVNILDHGQRHVARRFAGSDHHCFADLAWQPSATGPPVLDGTVAALLCLRSAVLGAGDHMVLFGLVEAATSREGEPLVFRDGAFQPP